MYDLVIVQCVKSKIWDKDRTAPRFVPAKDAYVSGYFKKMQAYAERYGKRWCVLSGNYGFLLPKTKIENYNATFINPRSNPIPVKKIKERLKSDETLKEGLGLDAITTCVVLGGKTYARVAKEVLLDYQIQIIDPLKDLPIGKKLAWLDEKVAADGKNVSAIPATEGEPLASTPSSEEAARKIASVLRDYHDELYEEAFSTVDRLKTAGLAKDSEDNQFLIDNPNAFLFGVLFDQQIRAERAWAAPRELYRRLGNTLSLKRIIEVGPEKLAEILHQHPALHRFCNKMGRWLVEASNILLDKYEGEAKNIWGGERVKALDVIQRLDEFPGISQKKANMTASILVRDFKVPITGWKDIDIPYDIHIRRVFLRSGLIENDSQKEVVAVGRKFSPDYPGRLDLPTWYVGRTWCRPQTPDCEECKLKSICPKLTEKGGIL